MTVRVTQFATRVITVLALLPSTAHLAALPNKISPPQAAYFTVQGMYRGWATLGLLWLAAIVLNG